MNPLGSDLFVNIPLFLVQTAFLEGAQGEFIADQVFPTIPVQRKVANYYTFDQDSWYRAEAAERAPSTPSIGGGWGVSTSALYNCRVYAIHKDVDYQTRAEQEANGLFDIDDVSTIWVTRQLLLKRELLWAATYFTTGVWTNNMTGVTASPAAGQFIQWDQASSTPIDDVTLQVENMREATGLTPNTLVLPPRVKRALRRNPQILDAAKSIAPYTGESQVTDALLAELFEVDRILVPTGIVNTAAEGAARAMAPIYGRHALLVHTPPDGQAGLQTPSGGYTFTWNGYLEDGGLAGNRIVTFPLNEIKSDRIEGEMAFDMRLTAPDLGVFWNQAIA
ncbi:MAG TPA: hypothetical protein VFL91_15270 [Thermomicrobiales bacterium]|nr:hypothetical protein [Thermomicrobiales bacterium]